MRPGHKHPPIVKFGDKSGEPVEEQNRMGLNGHRDDSHIDSPRVYRRLHFLPITAA